LKKKQPKVDIQNRVSLEVDIGELSQLCPIPFTRSRPRDYGSRLLVIFFAHLWKSTSGHNTYGSHSSFTEVTNLLRKSVISYESHFKLWKSLSTTKVSHQKSF